MALFDPLPKDLVHPYANLTGKDFALAVLNSEEFRTYILNGIRTGTLPSAVLVRFMDYGWGKPPDRVEHTGKDGRPIETITEVRRTVVSAKLEDEDDSVMKVSRRTH